MKADSIGLIRLPHPNIPGDGSGDFFRDGRSGEFEGEFDLAVELLAACCRISREINVVVNYLPLSSL